MFILRHNRHVSQIISTKLHLPEHYKLGVDKHPTVSFNVKSTVTILLITHTSLPLTYISILSILTLCKVYTQLCFYIWHLCFYISCSLSWFLNRSVFLDLWFFFPPFASVILFVNHLTYCLSLTKFKPSVFMICFCLATSIKALECIHCLYHEGSRSAKLETSSEHLYSTYILATPNFTVPIMSQTTFITTIKEVGQPQPTFTYRGVKPYSERTGVGAGFLTNQAEATPE